YRHDDRETDHNLGGCDRHREERQHLAVQRFPHAAEGDQGEVRGVQLKLDGHEDDQGVTPNQHTDSSDGEKDPRKDQEVGYRRPHVSASSAVVDAGVERARISACVIARSRLAASTIAATAPTINKIEVASKGTK